MRRRPVGPIAKRNTTRTAQFPRSEGSARSAESGLDSAGFGGVELAVDFQLLDDEGHEWGLFDHLKQGPIVLVFYRGDW